MLTGDTTEGVSKTEGATESASCDDESGEKCGQLLHIPSRELYVRNLRTE